MRKTLILALVMFVTALLGLTMTPVAKADDTSMSMSGYIVDTRCATANKDKLAEFVPTHPKDCAMAPDCHKSGYNLYTDGKLYKFDSESSEKVYSFLEKADSTLHVKADVVHGEGDMVKLVSISNAE
jgi:hypothetical protein